MRGVDFGLLPSSNLRREMGRPRKDSEKIQIYVATDDGVTEINGLPFRYKRDRTRVPEDHPVLKMAKHSFKKLDARYGVEQATAAPGELRGE